MTPKSTCVGWLGSEDFKALRSSYKKNEIIRIESIDKKRNERRLLHIWEVGADRASSNLGLGLVRTPAKLYGPGYLSVENDRSTDPQTHTFAWDICDKTFFSKSCLKEKIAAIKLVNKYAKHDRSTSERTSI